MNSSPRDQFIVSDRFITRIGELASRVSDISVVYISAVRRTQRETLWSANFMKFEGRRRSPDLSVLASLTPVGSTDAV